jgi:hypothetical protein
MRRLLAVGLLSFLLVSCVSVSHIVPAGQDTWMISGSSTRPNAGAAMKAELYQRASDYCTCQKKIFQPVSFNSYTVPVGVKDEAGLTFRCLDAGDPELTRPIMLPAPSTNIQMQR